MDEVEPRVGGRVDESELTCRARGGRVGGEPEEGRAEEDFQARRAPVQGTESRVARGGAGA